MPDYATWMSNQQIQDLKFSALKIPGTHDSGAYGLTLSLSDIKYGEIAFLWKFDPGQAPANGDMPWTGAKYYVGQEMYDFIMKVVRATATASDQSILQQLNGGIRYFDLRVYYDAATKDYHVQHALRGPRLDDIFKEVQQFIQEHRASQELVMLQLSHSNFSSAADVHTKAVAAMANKYFRDNVYMPPAAVGGKPWEFQSLSSMTVGEITGKKTAVMLLNADVDYAYASTVINVKDGRVFAGAGGSVSGVNTLEDLVQRERDPLEKNKVGNLYQVSWCLTPRTSDIMRQIQNGLVGNGAQPILQQMALDANNALTAFVRDHQKCAFNMIVVDWYETGGPQTAVDICVALSKGGSI